MTYKLQLFSVLQKKKKTHKYKIIQKLCFLWFTYIGFLFFILKKLKKKLKLDETHIVKLNSN